MIPLDNMFLVRQNFADRQIHDIPAAVQQQMSEFPITAHLQPGARIAIGVGSRGINNIAVIVHEVVKFWRDKGFKPFIFPAMGSHGDAKADEQQKILAGYGVTEDAMGCPIISSMDVVSTSRTPEGIETYTARVAHEADAVFLVNRVKPHTDFEGEIESGLHKMLVIGVGKAVGAKVYHDHAYLGKIDLGEVILSVSRYLLATQKNILGGLAILEDANNNTAQLIAMPAARMESMEREALKLVKSWQGHIPMDLDILIVDEIGKNISGTGMATKVINRSSTSLICNPWKNLHWIGRIYARSLSEESHGNGNGLGLADAINDQLVEKVDWKVTLRNAMTANIPRVISTPPRFPTDEKCLDFLVQTTGMAKHPSDIRVGWIINTSILNVLALTTNLKDQIDADPQLEIIGEAKPILFDAAGQLISRFPRAGANRLALN